MPTDKEFKTIENQIRLLRDRDLKINNVNFAKNHILSKNYFNLINGFETLLLDDPKNQTKKFTKKIFDDFVRLYEFDLQFSSLIFRKISEFETKLKSSIAYHFSKNHCSTLADNNNYIDINNYNGWLKRRIRQYIWKQWKNPRTKRENLIRLGIDKT